MTTSTPDPTGSGGPIVYADLGVTVYHGNCLDVLRTMPDASVDSFVTDPQYGLSDISPEETAQTVTAWASGQRDLVPDGKGFMGAEWDAFVPPPAVWDECLRVLKPGGHLLAFAGTRMFDLMTLSIRFAGFEIRDNLASLGFGEAPTAGLAWLYGTGWPKSRALLKPAFEPIVVARKPLAGTVDANVLAHGTGALNIDACRVPATDKAQFPVGYVRGAGSTYAQDAHTKSMASSSSEDANPHGRWPTNVVLDGDAADALDEQSGISTSTQGARRGLGAGGYEGGSLGAQDRDRGRGDTGGASRFFPVFRYQAKAPTRERPTYTTDDGRKVAHPTVKPVPLLRWLVRLVTPPGGRVLDPFGGTGTTGEAAVLEECEAILIEREADYIPLIRIRLDALAASRAAEAAARAEAATVVAETPTLFDPPAEEAS